MIKKLRDFAEGVLYSLPIQLLLNHIKRNQILLACWLVLFFIVAGFFGKYLGIPYLFLDPEYVGKINFTSFFIMGISIAGFSIAFHITSYINDGHRFSFIGTVEKPFTVFSLNNSIIPFSFLIFYVISIIRYQVSNEYSTETALFINLLGLIVGYAAMTMLLFAYFWFTNKDIFKYVVCQIDEGLKQKIRATRAGAIKKLNIAQKKQIKVHSYLDLQGSAKKVPDTKGFYDRGTILQVFDQNHLNLVIIELLIFALLLIMGIFKDYAVFQIPAAASFTLFLTTFVMFAGAFSYWFGNWSATMAVVMILLLNFIVEKEVFNHTYKAFGLHYNSKPAAYNKSRIAELSSKSHQEQDKQNTIEILENWKAKFDEGEKPKMIFVCVSGGGQRSALWTLNVLQNADSITDGKLLKNTMLMTGASGGLIGAGYFRELYLRKQKQEVDNIHNEKYLKNISSDNLNAIIFSLLMNDIFVGFQKFEYNGQQYEKDRGYSFEQQLNKNTEFMMDKMLSDYRDPEYNSEIPMMIMTPTIVNDGRKLYISPHNVSYMTNSKGGAYENTKINGIEFLRFFEDQGSENLRFLSGMRMSATFPYITPNITLPSDPPVEIMDAGITDNFGISDAVRFLYTFREWIYENTSEVIFLSIRDSEKDQKVEGEEAPSLFGKFTHPISIIYQNFESLQDITNDNKLEYAQHWYKGKIERVDIQYVPTTAAESFSIHMDSLHLKNNTRASLSWRLTTREKNNIIHNITRPNNQEQLAKLKNLLADSLVQKP